MKMNPLRLVLTLSSLSVAVLAGPSKPELYLNVNSKSLEKGLGLGILEPSVKWQTSGTVADYDVDAGVTMSVTDDVAMPYSLWGRIKKSIGGVNLSARIDTESSNMNTFGLDLQASKGATSIQLKGKADADATSVDINNVKLSQTIAAPGGGSLTMTPKYNLASQKADITVSYGLGDTTIVVDADQNRQKVTVNRALGDGLGGGKIAPSVTTEGDIELSYSRPVGSGTISATYKPNDIATVSYADGPWKATVTAPMDSFDNYQDRINFNIGRSVDVPLP